MEHSKAAAGLKVVLLLSRVLTHPSSLCASLSSCVMLRVRVGKVAGPAWTEENPQELEPSLCVLDVGKDADQGV